MHLAHAVGFHLYSEIRGGAVVILLGLTALISYSVGRQNAPTAVPPRAALDAPSYAKPVALTESQLSAPAIKPQPSPSSLPTPNAKSSQPELAPVPSKTKRKVQMLEQADPAFWPQALAALTADLLG